MRFPRSAIVALAVLTAFGLQAARPVPTKTAPLWDLARNGSGACALTTPFQVPQEAVRDSCAFAVEATVAFGEGWKAGEARRIELLTQKVGDTGWSVAFELGGRHGPSIVVSVGDEKTGCAVGVKPGSEHTYAVRSRNGMITLFADGIIQKRWIKRIVPNLEPVQVGPAVDWPSVRLTSLKFFGPDEPYSPVGEEKLSLPAVKSGEGWSVNCPVDVTDAKRPKVLCWGDSIMLGYSPCLRRTLEGRAYVYDWAGFCTEPVIPTTRPWEEAAAIEKFAYIVFNNGLHSLHWREDLVKEADVEKVYHTLVKAFRTGAPQAKLIYLTTTPLLKAMPKGVKPDGFSRGNAVVERLNRIAVKVMQEEGVQVIDLYTVMCGHLDYANGGNDIYHWTKAQGYPLMAETIAKEIK